MNNINKLTLEQEFKLTIYKNKIYYMSNKNTKRYLKEIIKKMMLKDNIIKFYIKNSIIWWYIFMLNNINLLYIHTLNIL